MISYLICTAKRVGSGEPGCGAGPVQGGSYGKRQHECGPSLARPGFDAVPGRLLHRHAAEDAFFGPEQLAQAGTGGAPVVVPVPQDQNVIRVQVNPGEIIELSSPFDGGAELLGREADGNLAIRVGDVTVILVGFVDAQCRRAGRGRDLQWPTDRYRGSARFDRPHIDIQTAAGPGDAAGAQGADNTVRSWRNSAVATASAA